ncbi:hypothetical protein NECID01_1526 [Nematocida sp. AWRm77]|nr:hypothetical protein NECID01_1526 [Nematocida sp. AWRm77]
MNLNIFLTQGECFLLFFCTFLYSAPQNTNDYSFRHRVQKNTLHLGFSVPCNLDDKSQLLWKLGKIYCDKEVVQKVSSVAVVIRGREPNMYPHHVIHNGFHRMQTFDLLNFTTQQATANSMVLDSLTLDSFQFVVKIEPSDISPEHQRYMAVEKEYLSTLSYISVRELRLHNSRLQPGASSLLRHVHIVEDGVLYISSMKKLWIHYLTNINCWRNISAVYCEDISFLVLTQCMVLYRTFFDSEMRAHAVPYIQLSSLILTKKLVMNRIDTLIVDCKALIELTDLYITGLKAGFQTETSRIVEMQGVSNLACHYARCSRIFHTLTHPDAILQCIKYVALLIDVLHGDTLPSVSVHLQNAKGLLPLKNIVRFFCHLSRFSKKMRVYRNLKLFTVENSLDRQKTLYGVFNVFYLRLPEDPLFPKELCVRIPIEYLPSFATPGTLSNLSKKYSAHPFFMFLCRYASNAQKDQTCGICMNDLCYVQKDARTSEDADALQAPVLSPGSSCGQQMPRTEKTLAFSNSVVVLPCSHVFHYICIDTWMNEKQTCPYCRNETPSYHAMVKINRSRTRAQVEDIYGSTCLFPTYEPFSTSLLSDIQMETQLQDQILLVLSTSSTHASR